MAKFLTTRKTASELEDLIKKAGERLFLVSPYLKLSPDFRELLRFRSDQDKVTTIVFGKQELKPEELAFLVDLRFVALKFNENLHAKAYANDERVIITSMNLYEYSMSHNKEMGVLIERSAPEDVQLFKDAMDEIDFIVKGSERWEVVREHPESDDKRPGEKRRSAAKRAVSEAEPERDHADGYCIRTRARIPFNVEKPMSYEAYRSWKSDGADPDEPQKFCHFSGDPSEGATTVNRPILRKHWKEAQALHDL